MTLPGPVQTTTFVVVMICAIIFRETAFLVDQFLLKAQKDSLKSPEPQEWGSLSVTPLWILRQLP